MPINPFDNDAFSTISLTTRANESDRHPFVESFLAGLFETTSITDTVAMLERGESGIEIIEAGTRETLSPSSSLGRSKTAKYVGSTKLGRVVSVSPSDIQSVRQLGGAEAVETLQSIIDSKQTPVFRSIDHTHEYLRLGALRGVQLDADGVTPLNDFYNLFGIAQPGEVYFELDATSPDPQAIRKTCTTVVRTIRNSLGDLVAPNLRVGAVIGDDFSDGLRYAEETREAFQRWEDLAQPEEAASLRPFRYGGIDFYPYRGAGLAADEARFFPMGVPGMFRTVFTPADTVDFANTLGVPRYVIPNEKDFNRGWEAEIMSFPIHYCLRPEALLGGRAGAAPSN